MADDFTYDVFLSHSSKDKSTVRALAERLRADGVRVWLDEWEIKPGDDPLNQSGFFLLLLDSVPNKCLLS